ncbi:MAG: GNAT family N-acetyltransferase [Bradymonadia bacterium]
MHWTTRYAHKIGSHADAVRRLLPGRRIFIGSGAAEPLGLVDALCAHGDHLADNEIVHLLTLGEAPHVAPEMASRFRHTAFFIGANVREAVGEGRADFMPVFLSEIPKLIRSRRIRIDAALIQISPPDAHGFASLGVSVDVVRAAVDSAGLILAEVNPYMPRTLGDSFVHMDQIDALVPIERPLPELQPPTLDGVTRQIGRNVADLIPNGATLQMGIGKIPDAVLAALTHHRDLGVHTEMFSDGVIPLIERGVINGSRKSILPGKVVTSFAMGTRRLYRWMHDNPIVEMRPSEFTNDPFTIARHERMIAINSALAVDLTGQVAADTLMGRFFSGIGGQVDFIRGAARSQGGRPIIALPSTAKKGQVSKITPAFEEGAGVVTSRGDVHYVVTEYGVAELWGKSIRERAMALIDIAHPDHRGELLAAAKRRRYVLPGQSVSQNRHPHDTAQVRQLPDGDKIMLRTARITDEGLLRDFLYRVSDNSIYHPFLAPKTEGAINQSRLTQLLDVDSGGNLAVLVCPVLDPEVAPAEEVVAMGQISLDASTGLADLAFIVTPAWQRKGLGTVLFDTLTALSRARGHRGFTVHVPMHNTPMLKVIERVPQSLSRTEVGERVRFEHVWRE